MVREDTNQGWAWAVYFKNEPNACICQTNRTQ
jgi:hypothetical protein